MSGMAAPSILFSLTAAAAFVRWKELLKKVAISLAMTGIKKESISSKSNSA
jgi:hypothetical protein